MTGLPQASDLLSLIQTQPGGWEVDENTASKTLGAVISSFETRTGYSPFFAETTINDYWFDVPYGTPLLDFLGGFAEIESITIVTTANGTEGQALVANSEYVLVKHPKRELTGYTGMQLLSTMAVRGPLNNIYTSIPQTFYVRGRRGITDDLPLDIFDGIVSCAFGRIAPFVKNGKGMVMAGIVSRLTQGPVTYWFNDRKLISETFEKDFDDLVWEYKRY